VHLKKKDYNEAINFQQKAYKVFVDFANNTKQGSGQDQQPA
jgi:hypothetical protein